MRISGQDKDTDASRKELIAMVAVILVCSIGVIWFSLWDAGYLGSYWERWEGGGDIKCFDAQGRVTTSSQQTCFVLTLRGIKERERLTEACKAKGESEETCLELAVHQLALSLSSKAIGSSEVKGQVKVMLTRDLLIHGPARWLNGLTSCRSPFQAKQMLQQFVRL